MSAEGDIVAAGAAGLAPLYRAGALTPSRVAKAYVDRIGRHNGRLNAYLHFAGDLAEQAKRSTKRWQAGLNLSALDGVPVAVKSNIAVAGLPHDGGIGAYRHRLAEADAEVVRRMRRAGMLVVGTLNMEEGALGAKTDNPWFGPTWNPWREGHTPGGSSGGSGAAVAAGLCAAALGTDTMGSVRIPASYCGLVGFKPARGAVPDEGLVPLSRTLDTTGPLARSVADARALYEVIAGEAVRPPATMPSVGFVRTSPEVVAAGGVGEALAVVVQRLKAMDVRVSPLKLPEGSFGRVRLAGLLVAEAEGWDAHHEAMAANPDGFSGFFTKMLRYGAALPDEKLLAAYAGLIDAERSARGWDTDALLLPTTPQTAFPMTEDHADQADLTAYANAAGVPAISVPVGAADGLPVGAQVVARDAGAAFALAEKIERAVGRAPMPPGY